MLLALALGDHAHDDGTHVLPGVKSLALKTRQTERAVQKQMLRLQAMGWLIPVKNSAGGRGLLREYRICPKWLKGEHCSPFSQPPEKPPQPVDNSQKGEPCSPFEGEQKGEHCDTKGRTPRHPYITTRTVNTPLPPTGGATGVEKTPTAGNAPGFDAFFAGYPRQVDEAQARRAWNRLAPSAELQGEIAQAIAVWIRSPEWQREAGRFIPKPGNWLRQQRWRDQPGIAAPPPPPAPPAPPPEPPATPEQLAQRRQRAREAVAQARAMLLAPKGIKVAAGFGPLPEVSGHA